MSDGLTAPRRGRYIGIRRSEGAGEVEKRGLREGEAGVGSRPWALHPLRWLISRCRMGRVGGTECQQACAGKSQGQSQNVHHEASQALFASAAAHNLAPINTSMGMRLSLDYTEYPQQTRWSRLGGADAVEDWTAQAPAGLSPSCSRVAQSVFFFMARFRCAWELHTEQCRSAKNTGEILSPLVPPQAGPRTTPIRRLERWPSMIGGHWWATKRKHRMPILLHGCHEFPSVQRLCLPHPKNLSTKESGSRIPFKKPSSPLACCRQSIDSDSTCPSIGKWVAARATLSRSTNDERRKLHHFL